MSGIEGQTKRVTLKEHDSYPRVVWVHPGGSITADVGGRTHIGGRINPTTGNREKTVRVQVADCQVHIWGEDEEAAEDIQHAIVSTCYRRLSGAVLFGSYAGFNEQPGTADIAIHGWKIIQSLTIDFSILAESKALTAVTGQGFENSFIAYDTGASTVVCN